MSTVHSKSLISVSNERKLMVRSVQEKSVVNCESYVTCISWILVVVARHMPYLSRLHTAHTFVIPSFEVYISEWVVVHLEFSLAPDKYRTLRFFACELSRHTKHICSEYVIHPEAIYMLNTCGVTRWKTACRTQHMFVWCSHELWWACTARHMIMPHWRPRGSGSKIAT